MDFLLPPATELHGEIEIKRSRFICSIFRTSTPEEAREYIDLIRNTYPDARHHCNAFAIGIPDALPVLHSSDDGEPAGTAGRPMLDVLTGVPLLDVVAVVTRYFGGTLLGTGGLVSAYGDSVRLLLDAQPLYARQALTTWEALLPHAEAGRYLADFSARGWQYEQTYLDSGVLTTIFTDDDVASTLASTSSGNLSAQVTGHTFRETLWGVIRGGKATQV